MASDEENDNLSGEEEVLLQILLRVGPQSVLKRPLISNISQLYN